MEDPQSTSPTTAAVAALERLGPLAVESRLLARADLQAALRALRSASQPESKASPPSAVTVKVAAARLGCCPKTVLRLVERGRLPAFRLTGSRKSLRIPEAAINALAQGDSLVE